MKARIGAVTPLGPARLGFAVGEINKVVELRISHPLQFVRSRVRTHRDNLAGEVLLHVTVENQSRRPVAGGVELTSMNLPGFRRTRPLDVVAAGSRATVFFEVAGLDPLELIAGSVSFDLAVRSEGVMHHGFELFLPDTVRDLGSRDLPELLVRQARDEAVPTTEIRAARALLLQRLREDWKVAAMGRGNPYKKDFRNGGTRTALGDLVQTCREEYDTARRPEVFEGLSGEILALADLLPGAHPFLRKYVRRLAAELP
jgi:hypothetical protein